MEEGFPFAWRAKERVEDLLRSERRRQGEIAAGDSFCDAKNVRRDSFMFAREHLSRSAKPGRDFIGDQ